MKATQIISEQMIEDLLVTALEGGSNYWYFLPDTSMCEGYRSSNPIYTDPDDAKGETPLSIQAHLAVLEGKKIPVWDVETLNSKWTKGDLLGYIDKDRYDRVEDLLLEKHPEVLANIINGDWDANDADIWFQLVVMDEVVYG